jgi:hypothetical protein
VSSIRGAHRGRLAVEAGHFGKLQHAADEGAAIFAGAPDLAQQFARRLRIFRFALGKLRHVDHPDQRIVELVGDPADHRAERRQLFELQDPVVLRVEPQDLQFQVVLPLVVALHPVERDIEDAQHARRHQQADQRHRGDRAAEGGLQAGDVADHHQFADVAPARVGRAAPAPREASARRPRSPRCVPPASRRACRLVECDRQLLAGLRQRDMRGETLPVAGSLHHAEPALPLFRTQEFLVYQHRQIDRQAVAYFIDQMLDFFADFEIAEHLAIASPGRDHPQGKRSQRPEFEAARGGGVVPGLVHRHPVDFIAELAGAVHAIQVDQINAGEVKMGDAVLGAQGFEQRPRLARQAFAVAITKRLLQRPDWSSWRAAPRA